MKIQKNINVMSVKFKEWYKNKLRVERYPLPTELQKTKAKYVINVSDEYMPINHSVCMERGIKYFWFPMDEVSSDIGVNSIFGALQILWIAEKENAEVLLHCHAGANRSPTVADAYYFLRTKTHLMRTKSKEDVEFMEKLFVDYKDDGKGFTNSRLLDNMEQGHLPCKNKMESFLKDLEQYLLKQDEFNFESGLNSIKCENRM